MKIAGTFPTTGRLPQRPKPGSRHAAPKRTRGKKSRKSRDSIAKSLVLIVRFDQLPQLTKFTADTRARLQRFAARTHHAVRTALDIET